MNLYVTQAGQLRFTEGRPYMELQGWCVRAGYSLNDARSLYGALGYMTRDNALKYARRAMNKIGYDKLVTY